MGRLSTVASLLLVIGCAKKVGSDAGHPSPPLSDSAVVFISSDLRGYLGPCGCSENMRGGIARAAFQVAQARQSGKPVLYLDAGNSLFGHLQLAPAAVLQEERKARALAQAFKLMGLSVRAVGELDDARGAEFRRSLALPELESDGVRLVEAQGRKVGVVSARTEATLIAGSKQARAEGAAMVIALYLRPLSEAQQAAALPGLEADLIVVSSAKDELSGDESKLVRAAVPVAQVQSKGRALLRLELTFSGVPSVRPELLAGQAEAERELAALDQRIELLRKQVNEPSLKDELKKLRKNKLEEIIRRREELAAQPLPSPEGKNAFSVRFIPLESNFESLPEAKGIVTAYDRDVGQINLEWAKKFGQDCPPPAKGEAAFVGNGSCKECHAEAFPVWDASKHALAYRTLEEVGKNFHLDCVNCHVTGANRPGGVCRIDRVEERKDVGCESCHGPGSIHAEDPSNENVVRTNQPKDCVGCHDPENSPHFEFKAYLAQILGPGHGRPLTEAKQPARPGKRK